MYKINEVIKESQVTHTEIDPVVGESERTILVTKLKPMKKTYNSYIEAMVGLDKIKKKGRFIIVKENIKLYC